METSLQNVFKSGDMSFITEKECLNYEKRLKDHKYRKDIIEFLLKEGFTSNLESNVFFKKDKYITVYEFTFLSDILYLKKYKHASTNYLYYKVVERAEEYIHLNLCNLETFKAFYDNMLGVKNI